MAHEEQSAEQDKLRKLTIDVFEGKRNLKMHVEGFPVNQTAAQAMTELHTRLIEALDGQRALSVKVESDPKRMGIPVR